MTLLPSRSQHCHSLTLPIVYACFLTPFAELFLHNMIGRLRRRHFSRNCADGWRALPARFGGELVLLRRWWQLMEGSSGRGGDEVGGFGGGGGGCSAEFVLRVCAAAWSANGGAC